MCGCKATLTQGLSFCPWWPTNIGNYDCRFHSIRLSFAKCCSISLNTIYKYYIVVFGRLPWLWNAIKTFSALTHFHTSALTCLLIIRLEDFLLLWQMCAFYLFKFLQQIQRKKEFDYTMHAFFIWGFNIYLFVHKRCHIIYINLLYLILNKYICTLLYISANAIALYTHTRLCLPTYIHTYTVDVCWCA